MELKDEKYFYIVRIINRLSSIRDIHVKGLFTKKEYAVDVIKEYFPIEEIIDTEEDLWIVKSTTPDLLFAIIQKLKIEK